MTIGIWISLAGLLLSIIGLLFKQGYDKGQVENRISVIEDSIKNINEHLDELYNSRLKTNEVITKLTENISMLKEKLDKFDNKMDKFNDKLDLFLHKGV